MCRAPQKRMNQLVNFRGIEISSFQYILIKEFPLAQLLVILVF